MEAIHTKIENALTSQNPIEALRELVVDLNKNGLKKEAICDVLHKYSMELEEQGRTEEAWMVEDVMDMITGWYSGRNIDLD